MKENKLGDFDRIGIRANLLREQVSSGAISPTDAKAKLTSLTNELRQEQQAVAQLFGANSSETGVDSATDPFAPTKLDPRLFKSTVPDVSEEELAEAASAVEAFSIPHGAALAEAFGKRRPAAAADEMYAMPGGAAQAEAFGNRQPDLATDEPHEIPRGAARAEAYESRISSGGANGVGLESSIIPSLPYSNWGAYITAGDVPIDAPNRVQPLFADRSEATTNDSFNQPISSAIRRSEWQPNDSVLVDLGFLVPAIRNFLEHSSVGYSTRLHAEELIERIEAGDMTVSDALAELRSWEGEVFASHPLEPEGWVLGNNIVGTIIHELDAATDGLFSAAVELGNLERDLRYSPLSNHDWFVEQYGFSPHSQQEAWQRRSLVDPEGYAQYIGGPFATTEDIAFEAGSPQMSVLYPDHIYDGPLERTLELTAQEATDVAAAALGFLADLGAWIFPVVPPGEPPMPGQDYFTEQRDNLFERLGWTVRDREDLGDGERVLYDFVQGIKDFFGPRPNP